MPTNDEKTPAPTLPDVLIEIAGLAPEQIQYRPERRVGHFVLGADGQPLIVGYDREGTGNTGTLFTRQDLNNIRGCLEEFVEGRGWSWRERSADPYFAPNSYSAHVVHGRRETSGHAATPAHALALAVLAALRAERGA